MITQQHILILKAGGNRRSRRKPARASMDNWIGLNHLHIQPVAGVEPQDSLVQGALIDHYNTDGVYSDYDVINIYNSTNAHAHTKQNTLNDSHMGYLHLSHDSKIL